MLLSLLSNVLELLSTVKLPLSDLSQLGLQRLLLFIDLVHFVILPRVLLILQLLVKLLQLALLLLQILLLLVQGRLLPLQSQLLSLEVLRLRIIPHEVLDLFLHLSPCLSGFLKLVCQFLVLLLQLSLVLLVALCLLSCLLEFFCHLGVGFG